MKAVLVSATLALFSYILGAVPFSYLVAKAASGKELTRVGTGNIGAMNVRRATGSWMWFFTAMILDGLKGFFPVYLAYYLSIKVNLNPVLLKGVALNFSVFGHNYSVFAWYLTGKIKSGRGLATGGGGLLAYNPFYLFIALAIGIPAIFISRYLLVGQVLTPIVLPVIVYFLNKKDFLPIVLVCVQVLLRHAERIPALLSKKEPQFYIDDRKND